MAGAENFPSEELPALPRKAGVSPPIALEVNLPPMQGL